MISAILWMILGIWLVITAIFAIAFILLVNKEYKDNEPFNEDEHSWG